MLEGQWHKAGATTSAGDLWCTAPIYGGLHLQQLLRKLLDAVRISTCTLRHDNAAVNLHVSADVVDSFHFIKTSGVTQSVTVSHVA